MPDNLMLRNQLKSAWRNIRRNKVNSILNISGLAIGLTCVLLIALYVRDELGFDHFLPGVDQIYQVNLDGKFGGQASTSSGTPPPAGAALHAAFPEIKTYTRTHQLGTLIVTGEANSQNQDHFSEKSIFGVDSNYLQVFRYPVAEGNAALCLQKPHSIVITASMARKYFARPETAVGKWLKLDQFDQPFIVTAVLKDVPSSATFRFDMLINMADCKDVKQFSWSWIWCQMNTYVVLDDRFRGDETGIRKLEQKFPAMVRVQAASAFKRIGQPFDAFIRKGGKWDLLLQPFTDVHLYSSAIGTNYATLGDIKYVYIFCAIGFFIIILACVNFMNLSTAQSAGRAKEVGIRKVLGSVREQLIRQFLLEAMLHSFIAAGIAGILTLLVLPFFNELSGKGLTAGDLLQPGFILLYGTLPLVTGLLAGIYPAFYLTSFNPVSVLKGVGIFKKGAGHVNMRNGLVVFQFAVSITLIICTMIVFQQLRFVQSKDIGLRKDNVLVISNAEKMTPGAEEAFRQAMLGIPGITNASVSSDVPGIYFYGFTDFYVPQMDGAKEPLAKDLTLTSMMVDDYFVPTLHMQLLKGRNFSRAFSDSASVILNESAAKLLGWNDPLGKFITYPGKDDQRFQIIGIVKDFNVVSLRNTIDPFALFPASSKTYHASASYILATVRVSDTRSVLQALGDKWKGFAPGVPFDYSFLDKDFEALYRTEERLGNVFGVFTAFSIGVACLGLLGLSIFTAQRRTKEIGIRKVLGASVQGLVVLLSKDLIGLVVIASFGAFPIAWWTMNEWLNGFAYRISITGWVFAAAGSLALLIAVCTMSFQAIKAALANPVKSLRTE